MRKLLLGLIGLVFAVNVQAATVYIEEFANQPAPQSTVLWQAAKAPGITKQTVAIGGSSTQSAAFTSSTTLIRVHTDAICSIEIGGTNPTATVTSMRFAANQTEYFVVNPGAKLAVITNN